MEENDINFRTILYVLSKNKLKLIFTFLLLFSVLLYFIWLSITIKSPSVTIVLPIKYNQQNLNLENKDSSNIVNLQTVHSLNLVEKTINKIKISANAKDIYNNISFIQGEASINNFANLLSDNNVHMLLKELSLDSAKLNQISEMVFEEKKLYSQIALKIDKINVTEIDAILFLNAFVEIINDEIRAKYDFADSGLKKLNSLNDENVISKQSIKDIRRRLMQIENTHSLLSKHYSNFAMDINLSDVAMDIKNFNENVQFLLIHDEQTFDYLKKQDLNTLSMLDRKIEVIDDLIEDFETPKFNEYSVNTSSSEITSYTEGMMEKLLSIGDLISSNQFLEDLYTEKKHISFKFVELEAKINDFYNVQNSNGLESSVIDQKITEAIQDANEITEVINNYIDDVQSVKAKNNFIEPISSHQIYKGSKYPENLRFIFLLSLTISLIASIAIIYLNTISKVKSD